MNMSSYQNIMRYFPLVNPNILDPHQEVEYTYTTYYSSEFPLKPIKSKDESYSDDILINLRTLRILLNSNLSEERFLYELNRLNDSWGPEGFYDKSILNSSLVKDINKINKEYQKYLEHQKQLEYQKQLEIMELSRDIVLEHQMKELEGDIKRITFKRKPDRNTNIKDLDFSKLNLNTHSKLIKKNNKSKNLKK